MLRFLVLFLALASCLQAIAQKALTNDDIIKMVKGGLSDDVILLAIESQPSNFDVSAQALIELKQLGASKAILEKILDNNSPAQWAFMRAFQGFSYSLDEIKEQLESGKIPFAFATKRVEKSQMKYQGTLSAADNLNKRGWKLCHIDGVGLRSAARLEDFSLERLTTHFRLLLKPGNHFLVPLSWAGLGELPEVIDEVRKYELAATPAQALRGPRE